MRLRRRRLRDLRDPRRRGSELALGRLQHLLQLLADLRDLPVPLVEPPLVLLGAGALGLGAKRLAPHAVQLRAQLLHGRRRVRCHPRAP
ncbi:MAG: hypothetical protein LC689_00185 [Myxococcales bacterium]|nr:hypothetical protein [Myxococcales bacterium]